MTLIMMKMTKMKTRLVAVNEKEKGFSSVCKVESGVVGGLERTMILQLPRTAAEAVIILFRIIPMKIIEEDF